MTHARTLFDLDGRTALITGGSRGLGLQIAEALGDFGARVLICARKADELERAVTHLRGRGIVADWIVADTGNAQSIGALADAALLKLEKVDILVNNAGASWGAAAEDYPLEAWDKVFNLNMRVGKNPGASALTVIPCGPHSPASARVKLTSAPLLAL
ncbi:MAG: SDR family NAD(P)-dependent oxidoreductase [Elusimicrobia bacterium]|nr:MAG: SDR family NAD(P)-dependent oxidoreductase [Elusimicrobiota bacterium]